MTSVEELVTDSPMAIDGVGDRLRAAREARGLTIADIAQTLKFSTRQVELVEANAWSELPGQTFVRGCVRNYARMLKIDPDPLLKDLESANLPKAAVLVLPGSTNATLPSPGRSGGNDLIAVFGGLLLVAIAVAAYFLVPVDFWRGPTNAVAPGQVSTMAAPPPPVAPAAAQTSGPESGAPAALPASGPATQTPAAEPSVPGANAVLRFEFDQASWVEVRDSNGTLLHSQNNSAGTVQEVSGAIPLSIVIGDARRVRMIYRDKPVDLAPFTNPQNNVARLNIE